MYGWLPAIARFSSKPIVTLKRYERIFDERSELSRYRSLVQFVDDEDNVLSGSDAIVCAKRPEDQVRIANHAIDLGWRGHFVLEKPLAIDPPTAWQLTDSIAESGNGLTIGFTIGVTLWARRLVDLMKGDRIDEAQIHWSFRAHHFRFPSDTWKRNYHRGGGALRFYGIHLLAVMSVMQDWIIERPVAIDAEHRRFLIRLRRPGLSIEITCDSDASSTGFACTASVGGQELMSVEQADPFANPGDFRGTFAPQSVLDSNEDPRILMLLELLKRSSERSELIDPLAASHLRLWERIEQAMQL